MTKAEFKLCFDQFFDPIRNYLYYRSGNSELATDIAQEVFMKVWEKQLDYEGGKIKSLLYKMAGDQFVSHFRKEKVAQSYAVTIELKMEDHSPQANLEFKEMKAAYERALEALPEKQRTVFLMSRMEEMTYKEIAERLELSIKAVEKRMSNAITELKKVMNLV